MQETQQLTPSSRPLTLSSLIQRLKTLGLKTHESPAPALETRGGSSYICSHKGRWEEKMKRKRCITNGGKDRAAAMAEGHLPPAAQPTG